MSDAATFARSILDAADIRVGGDRPWDIHVHDERLWNRVVRDRELGLGEAYQDGWWSANQLDEFIARVQEADLRSRVRPTPRLALLVARSAVQNRQSLRRAARNASAHYDIGNDLYERMLDKRMIYSCAYWRRADDLDTAQEAKLELICRKLGLEAGMRVLDIGCGWGGFAQFAAERHGVEVVGISPAAAQVALARERCAGLPVEIVQTDYREVTGRFDRIVSIGMIEHVGPKNYATFFERCRDLLEPDGMMLHHTIGSNRSKLSTDPWFDKYIFPGGVVPSLAQLAKAAEDDWAIEDVHNFGPDYDRTLMAWHANISARWDEIPHYDERFRRTWDYYLLGSAGSFRARVLQLWQIVFTRSRRRSPRYDAPR
ncbi:MAG: cyclopropane fatty acyl phospholipid synthase [Actinomyces sp.]|nr:MAG: cyclopropane fatty acyl phospholipid synthase [Actinomyces sp.]